MSREIIRALQLQGPIVFLQLSGERPATSADCERIVDAFLTAQTRKQ